MSAAYQPINLSNSVAIAAAQKSNSVIKSQQQKEKRSMRTEQFDRWLSSNLYPAMAGMCPSLEMYKENMTEPVARRYAELCEGKPENWFDRMLREKVYPVLA